MTSLPGGYKFLDLNISAIKSNLKKSKYIFNKIKPLISPVCSVKVVTNSSELSLIFFHILIVLSPDPVAIWPFTKTHIVLMDLL